MAKITEHISANNIAIFVVFIILVISAFLFITSPGIPIIGDSPETFSAEDSVNIVETPTNVTIELEDLDKSDNLQVKINDEVQEWDENNQITYRKASISSNIEITSIVDGNEYETFVHDIHEETLTIESDEENTHLRNQTYIFNLLSDASSQDEFGTTEWSVNNDTQEDRGSAIEYEFEDSGNYTISAETRVNDVDYIVEENIRVLEPDEVVVEAESDKINVTTLEEIMFTATEVSNQSVEEFEWDFGDDSQIQTGEERKYWYQEPGNYTVELSGQSEETGEVGTDEIDINVTELDEDEDVHELTVNTFDGVNNTVLNDTDISVNNVETHNTGPESNSHSFQLIEGEYEITAEHEDFEENTETVYVSENSILDIQLFDGSEDEEVSDEETTDEELEDSPADVFADFEQEETTESEEDVEEPDSLEQIISTLDGDGSSEDPYIITTVNELQAIEAEPSASYALGNDINAISTQLWNNVGDVEDETIGEAEEQIMTTQYAPIIEESEEIIIEEDVLEKDEDYDINYDSGEITFEEPLSERPQYEDSSSVDINYNTDNVFNGFEPLDIGNNDVELYGNGYSIDNLHINRPNSNEVALFKDFNGGLIEDVTLNGIKVRGDNFVGGVIGTTSNGIIQDVNVGGEIIGNNNVGGISGTSEVTDINRSSALVSINGTSQVGGITGNLNQDSTIADGFVQTPNGHSIDGHDNVGGIVGMSTDSSLNRTHTLAIVRGNTNVGGLVGYQRGGTESTYSYTSGSVSGESSLTVGGLIGLNEGELNNTYWDIEQTNQDNPIGQNSAEDDLDVVEGLETEDMQGISAQESMEVFNFNTDWSITETYPKLYDNHVETTDEIDGFRVVNSEEDDAQNTDLDEVEDIEINDTISSEDYTPAHTGDIFEDEDYNVVIHESMVEIGEFTMPITTRDTIGSTPVIYRPDNFDYPSTHGAELDGFVLDEENNTVHIYYTGLDEDGEEVDKEQYSIVTEVVNEEGENVEAQVTIDGTNKEGSVTRFENLPPESYDITIAAEGYQQEDTTVNLEDEDEFIEIVLSEE